MRVIFDRLDGHKWGIDMTAIECIEKLFAHLPADESNRIERDKAVNTLFFAEIGDIIARRFDEFSDPVAMFSLIEEAASESDCELSAMVLTGLVEQIQSTADGKPDLWARIVPFFGEKTSGHVTEMDAFFGIDRATSPSS